MKILKSINKNKNYFKMVYLQVNIMKMVKAKELLGSFGQLVLFMKVILKMEEQMGLELCIVIMLFGLAGMKKI